MTDFENDYFKQIRKDVDRLNSMSVIFQKKEKLINDLLNKYDNSEKKFIQKYAETKLAVLSYKITKSSYIFTLIALVFASTIVMADPLTPYIKTIFYSISVILTIVLVVYFFWIIIFEKEIFASLIIPGYRND
jgi:pilus assembly protein TadC